MSTLIIRDATLAVNGAPETRGDAGDHLLDRVRVVEEMSPQMVEDCLEVLVAAAGSGEDADQEVLIALTVIALSMPQVAARRNLNAVAAGRRVAARFERSGDSDSALAVIETLREFFPSHQALERDYDAILGRLGMVMDLAERYHDRAQDLLRQGRTEEAIDWLREVLQLDGSRTDVARKIRDLRLELTRGEPTEKPSHLPLLFGALLICALLLGAVRERSLRSEYRELPEAEAGDYESMRVRLAAIEAFLEDHPIWHGALSAVSERASLRIEVERLKQEREEALEREARERADQLAAADLARSRARREVATEAYANAITYLEQALELAPPDWEHREQVERDVAAIREYMSEVQSPGDTE